MSITVYIWDQARCVKTVLSQGHMPLCSALSCTSSVGCASSELLLPQLTLAYHHPSVKIRLSMGCKKILAREVIKYQPGLERDPYPSAPSAEVDPTVSRRTWPSTSEL